MEDFYDEFFDGLSKVSADSFRNEELLPTWDEMKTRLDKEMPQKKKRRAIIFFPIAAAILFLGGGLYLAQNKNINTYANQNSVTNNSTKNNKQNIVNNSAATTQRVINESIDILKQISPENTAPSNKNSLESKVSNSSKKNTIVISNKLKEKSNTHFVQKNKQEELLTINNNTTKKLSNTRNRNTDNETLVAQLNNNVAINRTPNQNSNSIKSINTIDSATNNTVYKDTTNTFVVEKPTKEKIKTNNSPHWNILLTLAPDYLFANINSFNRPGTVFGVGIDYVFNPHWRIRTGLLYNHTPIFEDGINYSYKPSSNLPTYTTLKLIDVKGYVNYIEMPLAVRYTINPKSKIVFNTSFGLSSHFFLKQDYTYNLLLDGTTRLTINSNTDPDDLNKPHILNNLVFSTGISFKLKNKLYLEIEPAFKLPLEELGEGHQNVGSIAMFFNLRYLLRKK